MSATSDDNLRVNGDERDHRSEVMASRGKYADAFATDYLAELREDWPG